MRIFLSCHGASLYGGERVLLALARGFSDRGHEVLLEFPHDGPAVAVARAIAGIRVWISERPRLPRNVREFLAYVLGIPGALRVLVRGIRRERPDVVWVNSLYNPLAALAARWTGTPVVWHLHERNFPGVLGRVYSSLMRMTSDRCVAVSEFVASTVTLSDHRIHVVHNALLERIEPHEPGRERTHFTIGYVGQLERLKRVLDLLEAVATLPDTRLLLVGDGKDRRRTERAITRLRLGDRVRLLGFQPDVRPFLREMDCLVVPSGVEAFGLVAAEAMAAGLPVVAARGGAIPEVLGDAALYYSPGDVAGLAAQIGRLASDARLAASLREQGLRRVERFSLERMIDQAIEIARDVRRSRAC